MIFKIRITLKNSVARLGLPTPPSMEYNFWDKIALWDENGFWDDDIIYND